MEEHLTITCKALGVVPSSVKKIRFLKQKKKKISKFCIYEIHKANKWNLVITFWENSECSFYTIYSDHSNI
jgi:hypothetical protein